MMLQRRIAGNALAIVFIVLSAAPILADECLRTGDSVSPAEKDVGQSFDPGFVRRVEDRSNDKGFVAVIEDRSNDAGFFAPMGWGVDGD